MTTSPRKILFSGASGLIGASLVRAAEAERIQTLQLIRREPRKPEEISWNPQAGQPVRDLALLERLDAAIHLSGANISAQRWNAARKREIVESRVGSTRALLKVLMALKQPPATLLCASATGIYGERGDEILDEESPPGEGFIADTCRAWEAEASAASEAGIRVVHLRFGVVLAAEGGALGRMLPVFRLGLGGNLGSGRQWMSWIALNDVVRAIFYILDAGALRGPLNIIAPNPVTNAEFTRALGRSLHRPAMIPVPRFALRLAFGEMADEVLLASTRAVPDRLLQAGFTFELSNLDSALKAIL
ncbi:MAG: TIGR01777 family oxidoreductase [Silvibacterium sp.]